MNRDGHKSFIALTLLIFSLSITNFPFIAFSADPQMGTGSVYDVGMDNFGAINGNNMGGMPQRGGNRPLNLSNYIPSIEPCPFTENSTDIKALWNSTIKMLEYKIAEQGVNRCDGSIQAANTLSQSLAAYQSEATGGADTSPGTGINCTNYELLFNSEYEQGLVAIANQVSFNAMSDYAPCNFEPDKQNCIARVFQTKVHSKRIDCRDMETVSGQSQKQQQSAALQARKLEGRIAAANKLSTDLNTLLKQIGNCDNQDLRNGILTAALNVATILASSNVGGAEGVAVSFAGGVIQTLTSIFNSNTYKDLMSEMKSMDDYNQLSCFFMQIQKKRCKFNLNESPPPQPPSQPALCLDRDAPQIYQIQSLSQTIRSLLIPPASNSGSKATPPFQSIYDHLAQKENNINGVPFFDFLQTYGKTMLRDSKVENRTTLTTQLAAIRKYDAQIKKLNENPDLDNSAERTKLLADIDPSVIVSVLDHYQESLFAADPQKRSLFDKFKAQEIQQKAYKDWILNKDTLLKTDDADYTTLQAITSTTLKALNRSFPKIMSKRVEDALDQAQSESPTDAWRYIRKIVNDCQLNAGVFLMDHKKPFTEISNSDEAQSFRKLCEPFTCETGIPPFQGKNGKDFGVYQCKASTTANQTLETMKKHSKPNQPIKICGKDLKDIRLQSGRDLRVGP